MKVKCESCGEITDVNFGIEEMDCSGHHYYVDCPNCQITGVIHAHAKDDDGVLWLKEKDKYTYEEQPDESASSPTDKQPPDKHSVS